MIRSLLSWRRLLGLIPRRFIFCYHDISEPSAPWHDPAYSTTPSTFRQHIEYLSRWVRWVRLGDIQAAPLASRSVAAMTFDDGFRSVRSEALPYLTGASIPFTVFLCQEAVEMNRLPASRIFVRRERQPSNGDSRANEWGRVYLDRSDVAHLGAAGVEFGNHSASHQILARCDPSTLQGEIEGSREFLAGLGIRSDHFALPYGKKGDYDARVLSALGRAGYRYVYTSNPLDVRAKPGAPHPLLLPRIGVTNDPPATVGFHMNRPLVRTVDL